MTDQLTLWDFDEATYDPERDGERLHGQLKRVYHLMLDGKWHRLSEIARWSMGTESSASARLRDLRKPKFGGHTIERRYVSRGLWEYRLARQGS